ncbi:MAG: hypothetical protein LBK41_06420 [Clostridiales bacterium]|jgi:hypothetical protein|nr:hypothetical protein [Clostridiales bacterium]
MNKQFDHGKTLNAGRQAVLVIAALSLVNVALTLMDAGISFTFSASFPTMAIAIGQTFAEESGSSVFWMAGLAVAALSIVSYFLCWILSKAHPFVIVIALVMFVLDTLLLLVLFYLSGNMADGIIDIVFHALALFYLIKGAAAWNGIRKQEARG